MRTLYFDCSAGASGDMILGAFVAAGVDIRALTEQLAALGIEGYSITSDTVDRAGIAATHVLVQTVPEHRHRHLRDILRIIDSSQLSDRVKHVAGGIFRRLAEAEACVHNQPVDKVHFHEVGALDAIVDVVGAAICFELLGVESFLSSPLHVGSGFVTMDHGTFSVPPPAVAELLKTVPFYSTDVQGELLTPTGAAIITTVSSGYGGIPMMKLDRVGYGAGTRNYDQFPNVLRVFIGEQEIAAAEESLWMLETNIDDMAPQVFGHVMDRAFELGALDCYFTSTQMKKNRPGVLISILCRTLERQALTNMLFAETTTLGVRSYQVSRSALLRETIRVHTEFGGIDVKVARFNGQVINEMPEYEQCRQAARVANVSLRVVEDAAKLALLKEKM